MKFINKVFTNRYEEIRSGWAITAGILFFFVFQMCVTFLLKDQNMYFQALVQSAAKIINAICLVYLLGKFYKRPLYSMGFSKHKWLGNFIYGVIFGFIAITIVLVTMVLTESITIKSIQFSNILSLFVITNFFTYLTVGLIEETLFRAYNMTSLQTTRSKWLIVLLSAVIFSLLHLGNVGTNIVTMINVVAMGLIFSYIFIKTGSIWMSIGFHFAWDFFEVGFYGFTSNGVSSTEAILQLEYSSKDFITGGSFGPEGGIVVTIVSVLIVIWAFFFVNGDDTNQLWSLNDNPNNYKDLYSAD